MRGIKLRVEECGRYLCGIRWDILLGRRGIRAVQEVLAIEFVDEDENVVDANGQYKEWYHFRDD